MPYEIIVTIKNEIKKINDVGPPSKRLPSEIQCYTVLGFVQQYFEMNDDDHSISNIQYYRNSCKLYDWNFDHGRLV